MKRSTAHRLLNAFMYRYPTINDAASEATCDSDDLRYLIYGELSYSWVSAQRYSRAEEEVVVYHVSSGTKLFVLRI